MNASMFHDKDSLGRNMLKTENKKSTSRVRIKKKQTGTTNRVSRQMFDTLYLCIQFVFSDNVYFHPYAPFNLPKFLESNQKTNVFKLLEKIHISIVIGTDFVHEKCK